mgnify:FL=1
MKLFLLRHAEAEDSAPDALRPLTKYGRRSVIDLASFLKDRIRLDYDEIWHSPLIRAVETANLFRESTGLKAAILERTGLYPMDDPEAIIGQIDAQEKSILLVGHNPHFEALTATLLGLDPYRTPVNVPKASLLRFRRYGQHWQLRDLLTTKVTGR